jgi:hypothetical protein
MCYYLTLQLAAFIRTSALQRVNTNSVLFEFRI